MSTQLGNVDRAGLQSLATELLYNICEQASLSSSGRKNTNALCRIRLVCKQLDFAVQLLLFVDVDLSTMKESLQLETTRSQLQMLANGNSAACRLSKSLTIRCGDLFSPSLPARITSWDNWKSADNTEIELTKQALTLLITPTITSLYQTRKVRWVVGHYEPHSNIVAILDGLRCLPNLEDLTIELSRVPEDEFPLSWLSNLRLINISWRCMKIPTLFIHQLSRLIQQSQNLSRLDIRAVHKSARTLQQLFSGCSNPLRLEHLSLRGLCVTPDDFKNYALPHLKVLKSFSLTENTYIAPGGRDKFVPPNREIWEVLHCAKIQLSVIETDVAADPSLLEYLSTFRDCQGLTLSPNMGTWSCFKSAHRFFHNILPGMITTLEKLTLIPGAAGPWCFRDELKSAVLKCQNIRHLEVKVDLSSSGIDADILIHSLIRAASQLPMLRHLTIWPSVSVPPGVCPLGLMEHQASTEGIIKDLILTFAVDNPEIYQFVVTTLPCHRSYAVLRGLYAFSEQKIR